jgi:predicted dinucleotide-utilizing enzyme
MSMGRIGSMASKALSVSVVLVVDVESKKLYHEITVRYADGSVRSIQTVARQCVCLDLDMFYAETSHESAAH